jgi:hypothetical protein
MSFGDILGNALKYWMSGLRYYLPLYLAVQLLTAGVAYGLIFLSVYNPWILLLCSAFVPALGLGSMLGAMLGLVPIDFMTLVFFGGFIAVILTSMVLQLLVTATVIQHGADTHAGAKPSLGRSFELARTRVVSLLGATILVTLITLSFAAAALSLLMMLLFSMFLFLWNPLGLIVMLFGVLGGAVLCFILLIYVMVRLSVFAPAVVLSGASAASALGQSWKLAHGHFWRIFGITIIIGLLTGVITSIPTSVTMFSIFLPMPAYATIIFMIVYAVLNAVALPLSPLAQTMIYEDLYARYYGA